MLVPKAAQLEARERGLDRRLAHHAPRVHVLARGRPERREVAREHLCSRLDGLDRLGLLDRDEATLRARSPERRLVVVEDVGTHPAAVPGAPSRDPGQAVLALEQLEPFRHRHGPALASARTDGATLIEFGH